MLYRILLVAGLLAALSPLRVAAQSSEAVGLMLGLQAVDAAPEPLPYAGAPDSLAAPRYRTLLFSHAGDSIRKSADQSGLFLPGPERIWRAGVKRSVYNDWVEDFVWATPVGEVPTYAGIDPFNGEYCEGHRTHRITYAGRNYLALRQRSAGYCEGATHPWTYHTLAVVPLDSASHLGLTIAEVLGPVARRTLIRTARAFLDTLDAAERERFIQEPDEANWTIMRRSGQWVVRARLGPASEAEAATYADFPLDVVLPDELALGGNLPPGMWRRVIGRFPRARDAAMAPDGRFVVILHDQRLTVHPLKNGEIQSATMEVPVARQSTFVSVRPVTGPRLLRWRRVLRNARPAMYP